MPREPHNLTEWRPKLSDGCSGKLFTCGRPGRGIFGTGRVKIGAETIDLWVNGLPKYKQVHIVSLLGQKTDGHSEFEYYPFQSSTEVGAKPIFEAWMQQRYRDSFIIHEYPTTDRRPIQPAVLSGASGCAGELLAAGNKVLIMDSGGAERTRSVCLKLGFARL
jgi:hypothetical protein